MEMIELCDATDLSPKQIVAFGYEIIMTTRQSTDTLRT